MPDSDRRLLPPSPCDSCPSGPSMSCPRSLWTGPGSGGCPEWRAWFSRSWPIVCAKLRRRPAEGLLVRWKETGRDANG